jgi:Family of unknown function (DUF5317)
MLIGLAFLLCLLTVPLAGGNVAALANVRMRARWLLAAGLGLQVLIISVVPGGDDRLHAAAHVASYALVAGFVAANWAVPYLWLIALGGALNAVAIAFNGGVMPADPGALAAAGLPADPETFSNSTAVADPVLLFLGDVMWIPASWPVSNVFSIGDVLIVVGAFLALHTIAGSRLAVRRLAVPRGARSPRTNPA